MKITSRTLKERYYFNTLPNGLPVIFMPRKDLSKKTAVISVNYGAIDLDFKQDSEAKWLTTPAGVAHFLEHQLFKKESGNLIEEFGKLGGYYNAGTGYTNTSYFFTCSDNFKENLQLLLRLVWEPYFSPEFVLKEKSIIEQELRMYLDMPDIRLTRNLMENLYHSHPVRCEIGGTVESIQQITPETLLQCHQTFYHPSNMLAIFVGDLDYNSILQEISRYFKTGEMGGQGNGLKIERKPPQEPPDIKSRESDIRMAVNRPRILIGFKDKKTGYTGNKLLKQEIITEMMLDYLFGKSSSLYNRLYNEGLVDETFHFSYEIHPTYGVTFIGGETDRPDELYKRILSGIKKAQQTRIKKRQLAQLKRKYLGKFVRLFDSPEHISFLFAYYHFNNLKLFETPAYLKQVLVKDIQNRLETGLDEIQHGLSIIRPAK